MHHTPTSDSTGGPDPTSVRSLDSPKVIYVMGAGRSGSTVLGVALGNCQGLFYAGELDKWLMRSGVPSRDDDERMLFWASVREQVAGAGELIGRRTHRYLERSSAVFRPRSWYVKKRLRTPYRRVAEEVFHSIARTAKVTHIVDTAHYPLRARELQGVVGIELYLIFLVRDPQSIVSSFEREDVPEASFGPLKTNAYLWLTYTLSLFVFLKQPRSRRMLLRHEDFVEEPERILAELLKRLDSPAAVPDLSALDTGFPLQGNRLIHSDVIALKSGRPARRPRDKTTLLQLPWSGIFARLRPRVGVDAA